MRTAILTLAFLLELACFAGLAYAGAVLGDGVWAVVLAVLLPAAAIAVWARFNAPRSAHRLPTPRRIPLELAVFVAAAVALALAGAVVAAGVFAVAVVVNTVLTAALGDSRT